LNIIKYTIILFYFNSTSMNKKIKIVLYCILGIILIIAIFLMLWKSTNDAGEPDTTPETIIWEDLVEIQNDYPEDTQRTQSFEEDVMNDLENLFNNSNGYENIGWEFWFTNINE